MLNVKIFKADEIIVHMGTNGDAMYFILEGNVLVYNDNMQVSLKDGEFFGEIALIKDVPRTATVKALNDCRILELTTKDFTNFIEKKPELLKEIKKVADSRFEAV
jgi:CRP-like cAMP-binding protein